jgi:16S rRNA (guanine(966)-N(2))-methyltransferase RsmD
LRIIGGRLKGRRIDVPAVAGLRPTGDRTREALFSILGPTVEGARVLDAYAGSGALGLEAISRGASRVLFVEVDPRSAAAIQRVLDRLGLTGTCHVRRADVVETLTTAPGGDDYDLILADPPYEGGEARRFLPAAARRLAPGGTLVLERDARSPVEEVDGLERSRSARYGRSRLDFYSRGPRRDRSEPPG